MFYHGTHKKKIPIKNQPFISWVILHVTYRFFSVCRTERDDVDPCMTLLSPSVQRPWMNACWSAVFMLRDGGISERNVSTNSAISNDLGLSLHSSVEECMLRQQHAQIVSRFTRHFSSIDHDLSLLWWGCHFIFKATNKKSIQTLHGFSVVSRPWLRGYTGANKQ